MNEHSHKVIIQIEPQQRAFLHKVFDLAHESGMLGHGIAITVKADTPNDRERYKIICNNCGKEYLIDDRKFSGIVELIEDKIGDMADILYSHDVPVAYKSHEHISPILEMIARCCMAPDLEFCVVKPPDSLELVCTLRNLTASISEAETTASPTAAAALQEARGHLLRASMAVERAKPEAHTEPKTEMITGHCRYCPKIFKYPNVYGLAQMIRAHEATCPERPKGDDVTLNETDVPIVPQAQAEQGAGT